MSPQIKYFTADPQPNLDAAMPAENAALTLAYSTIGSPDRPAVLIPTCYAGAISAELSFLHTVPASASGEQEEEPVLKDYFVILAGLLGCAESSSPSNAHPSLRGTRFPQVTYEDNVRLQRALCAALGVGRLAAYVGFSMGAQQAYHMGALYPDFVERAVVLAGSARTSAHNWAFLEGPKAALVSSVDFKGGEYGDVPARKGTAAFARAWAPWAVSPEWFRRKLWRAQGFRSAAEALDASEGEGDLGSWDANDLLLMLQTWQRGDISLFAEGGREDAVVTGGGSGDDSDGEDPLPRALAAIKARVLLMPCRSDMYFRWEDSAEEVKHLRHGELRVIESVWGHMAAGGAGAREDTEFIKAEVRRWLAS